MPKPYIPLKVEIVGVLPTLFGHCSHCDYVADRMKVALKKDQADEYPPAVIEENHRVSETVYQILENFPGKAQVEIVNAVSPAGFWKALKYRLRSNSALIVNGKKVGEGIPEYSKLEEVLKSELEKLQQTSDATFFV